MLMLHTGPYPKPVPGFGLKPPFEPFEVPDHKAREFVELDSRLYQIVPPSIAAQLTALEAENAALKAEIASLKPAKRKPDPAA